MSGHGFTLTEIMIAAVLIVIVVLAATSVDITSRRLFSRTEDKTGVQDEAKIALQHIAGNLCQAHQIYDFGVIAGNPYTIGARLDIDATNRLPNNTPADDSDDTWVIYRYVSTAAPLGEIWYYSDAGDPAAGSWGNSESIASEIFVDGTTPDMFTVNENQIDINITAQNRDQTATANLQTSVVARSISAR